MMTENKYNKSKFSANADELTTEWMQQRLEDLSDRPERRFLFARSDEKPQISVHPKQKTILRSSTAREMHKSRNVCCGSTGMHGQCSRSYEILATSKKSLSEVGNRLFRPGELQALLPDSQL